MAETESTAPNIADLTTKELRKLLKRHDVDVRGCLERSDFEQAWKTFLIHDGVYIPENSKPEPIPQESTKAGFDYQAEQLLLGGLSCATYAHNLDGASQPDLIVVFLHGYGASNGEFTTLGAQLSSPRMPLASKKVWYCCPQAPSNNAWWPLNLMELQAKAFGSADGLARLIREPVAGLPEARSRITGLLEDIQSQTGLPASKIVLGGFSQGAILTVDVALHLTTDLAGICVFSGFPQIVEEWAKQAANHRNLPVFQAHGQRDFVLPFAGAGWLKELLETQGEGIFTSSQLSQLHGLIGARGLFERNLLVGLKVEYHPHGGAHDLGGALQLEAASKFIANRI
eukprot:TRINITY_DN11311_c1_g1_i3.p1 TRINITY_DN11311_c1_g1~~TRINITY_DN11311_c1_g1_i3.p1  ORF type:complete len:342 (+),score=52.77 TRINITY_DN11311_c1_g1_i3:337-1362(+)